MRARFQLSAFQPQTLSRKMHNHPGISIQEIVHLHTDSRLLLAACLFIIFLDFLELGIDYLITALC